MHKKLPIGIDDFAELVDPENHHSFADKTLFIRDIIDDSSKVILVTRPRRWGKSLNMSMLHYFFAPEVGGKPTRGLFDTFAIAQVEQGRYIKEYQGQYPVISISFKDLKETNFSEALEKIKVLFQNLFEEYHYLLESIQLTASYKTRFEKYLSDAPSPQELTDALRILSQMLNEHFGKEVYILIDEYDTPLNAAYRHGYLEPMTEFMKSLFSAALKGNRALKKGILTGILRISKDSMLSGLNNLEVYTLLNERYKSHFGFTDAELDQLFAEQGLTKDEPRVKAWYNGYQCAGLTLYNPWSIINSLKNRGSLQPYWVNTADDSMLRDVLQNASVDVKIKFQQLIEGKVINGIVSQTIRYDDITNDEVSIWSLLLSTGYLTSVGMQLEKLDYLCQLRIPNQEVLALYETTFIQWMKAIPKQDKLKLLLESLVEGHIEKFTQDVSDFLQMAASIHDYAKQPEAFYHGFMLALTSGLTDFYYVESNAESGLGRPDLLFIPKDTHKSLAVILEFKQTQKGDSAQTLAQQALQQIDNNNYIAKIKQYAYIKQIMKIGLVFDGKLAHCESQMSVL